MSNISKLIQELCPDGVEFKSLNDLGKFYGGLKSKSKNDFQNGNARYISYKNIYSNIATDLEASDFVSVSSSENQLSLQYGDVLMTGSSENREEVGLSSVVASEPLEKIYLNSFSICYRFNVLEGFNPDFVKYLFRSLEMRKQIEKTANGVTRINVSKKLLGKVKIPLVPLEIQTKIAKILDKFTLLEAELEAELEARRKQYTFYREFMLKISDENSVKHTLGDIGPVRMCKRILKKQTSPKGGIPFYKIGTFGKKEDSYISKELYDEYRRKYHFPKKGDLLISAAGTIGRIVEYDGGDAYYQDSNIVWLDNDESIVLNSYLKHFYRLNPWRAVTGGTISRLYNDLIRKVEIQVPPIEEQQRIVDILDRFDALVNDISSGLPAEIAARRKQYEHYRDQLLTFKEREPAGS